MEYGMKDISWIQRQAWSNISMHWRMTTYHIFETKLIEVGMLHKYTQKTKKNVQCVTCIPWATLFHEVTNAFPNNIIYHIIWYIIYQVIIFHHMSISKSAMNFKDISWKKYIPTYLGCVHRFVTLCTLMIAPTNCKHKYITKIVYCSSFTSPSVTLFTKTLP